MKRNLLPCSIHAVLAFCVSFGVTGSFATGLSLKGSLWGLALLCAFGSAVFSLCFCFRKGPWIGTLTLLPMLVKVFWRQMRDIGRIIFNNLHLGYGLDIPSFFRTKPTESHALVLLFLALVVSFAAVWVMSRKGSCAWVTVISLSIFAPCVLVIDTVPGSLYLGIWLTGMVMLLLTQELRRRDEAQSHRLSLILIVPVVLGVLALFWFLPRGSAPRLPNFENLFQIVLPWQTDTPPSILTESNQVDLNNLKKPSQSNTVIMTVTGSYNGKLYLRGIDYDRYNGLGWATTEGRQEAAPMGTNSNPVPLKIHTNITFNHFFVPYTPSGSMQITGGLALDDGRMPNPLKQKDYGYLCTTDMSFSVLNTAGDRSYFTQLPDSTRQALDEKNLSLQDANPVLTANRIAQYVSGLAPYSLDAKSMPGDAEDFALWFLESGESGFCVHYATTATVLLRYYGIPARYVEGYTVYMHEGTTPVTDKTAHAWVEYYVAGHGWKLLDPTPGDPAAEIPEVTVPTTEPTTQPTTQPTTAPTTQPTTAPTTEPTTQTTEFCEDSSSGICQLPDEEDLSPWLLTVLIWLLAVTVCVIAFFGQWALRRYRKLKTFQTGSPNVQALAKYREIALIAKLLKQPISPELTALAEKAKYSQHMLTAAEGKQFDHHLRTATQALKRAPLPKRLIAKWFWAAY